ncbi:hypothetical protein GCM10009119_27100 [Algoriphagus jejuensis]|uniref:Outer membrane protein with beta-barrel domain n=1 Tax=Algoriphagus jejuensis TaxID=419934 RepID=A0ABP3YGC1_9BACT
MKNSILLVCLLLCGASVFAQGGLEVKGYFGLSASLVGPKAGMVGINSGSTEGYKELGLGFSYGLGQKFRINGGLNYAFADVEYSPPPCMDCLTGMPSIPFTHNTDFEMLSIPVYAEYSLTKFLFVAAGPVVDFQLSEWNRFSDQSGLGFLAGLGGKVQKEKFVFSIFPNYKRHAVVTFEKPQGAKETLQELGVQFGVGYRF